MTTYLAEQEKRILTEDLHKFYKNIEPIYAWRLCKMMEVISAANVYYFLYFLTFYFIKLIKIIEQNQKILSDM